MLAAQKKYSPSPRLILLISLMLVLGSFFSLAHASQHSFHQADQSCEAFLSIEKNSVLDSPLARYETDPGHARLASVLVQQLEIQSTRLAFSSRAPPSF